MIRLVAFHPQSLAAGRTKENLNESIFPDAKSVSINTGLGTPFPPISYPMRPERCIITVRENGPARGLPLHLRLYRRGH
jgi:hypothetical protein